MTDADDESEWIEIRPGLMPNWMTLDGLYIREADFFADGLRWRVHKNDADPFPSRPHAHCVAGQERFVGCKLHLGTGQLFRGRKPQPRKLSPQCLRELKDAVRKKIPDIDEQLKAGGTSD